MLVSQTAEYAFRAMAFIASLPDGVAGRARDISAGTGIPAPYAAKILRRMVEHGLLLGQKGHGGGFRLARPRDQIRFLDILEASDEPVDQDRCSFGWGQCGAARPCALHHSMIELRQAVLQWASKTTLASLKTAGFSPVLPERPARKAPQRGKSLSG
jgi:Rrf2 family protein